MQGCRVRLTGILSRGKRGLILATEDNRVWIVESDRAVDHLIAQRVSVEGTTGGLDRPTADWIGATP